jgi:hypothetical protein
MTTKMTALKHHCKDLHQQNPLIIPAAKRPEKQSMLANLVRHSEHHKELG